MESKLGDAIDLSHHLSELAKRRKVSPLKNLQKYVGKPGTIMLAGGLPDPSYFPFSSIGGDIMTPDSFSPIPGATSHESPLKWLWKSIFGETKERTEYLKVPRYADKEGDIDLASSLQYGPSTGVAQLQKFLQEFTRTVYKPAYANWTNLIHLGNTDGWSRCFFTLCNPGEGILMEEWTYPAAMTAMHPYELRPVPVKLDTEGMSAEDLERVLSTWDECARGMKRPHVMYTVPIGQNPCGMTMGIDRKRAIYELCVKYDVIIVEDDPYYFMQEGTYVPKAQRKADSRSHGTQSDENAQFLASLAPSFLRIDYQGRVVRIDSFSKTIAPGTRMGWFTCNPVFAERFERHGEVTTQRPSGFSQALIGQLLTKQWGLDNYVRWLRGLQAQYTDRRDFMMDCFIDSFDVSLTYSDGKSFIEKMPVYVALAKAKPIRRTTLLGEKQGRKPIFSFVAPTSGMYIWIKMHFENHPSNLLRSSANEPEPDPLPDTHENELWLNLANEGLLISPGWFYACTGENVEEVTGEGHYRISFSSGEFSKIKAGIDIFTRVVQEYFEA